MHNNEVVILQVIIYISHTLRYTIINVQCGVWVHDIRNKTIVINKASTDGVGHLQHDSCLRTNEGLQGASGSGETDACDSIDVTIALLFSHSERPLSETITRRDDHTTTASEGKYCYSCYSVVYVCICM